ncbi:hypothetical protein CIB84_016448, partial [Bambusicola thoracicus]
SIILSFYPTFFTFQPHFLQFPSASFCFAPQLSELRRSSSPSTEWVCKQFETQHHQNNYLQAAGSAGLCHDATAHQAVQGLAKRSGIKGQQCSQKGT